MKPEQAIRQKVNAMIQGILPEFNQDKARMGLDHGAVAIIVSSPRDYMGRYDEGKYFWTIDIKESATYSRMKQVRVKIIDGEPVFDADKLRAAVLEMHRRVIEHNTKKRKDKEQMKLLGSVPDWLDIEPSASGWYGVRYGAVLDLEQTKKFIEFVKSFVKSL